MRFVLFALAALIVAAPVSAGDWVDNGDGSWTLSVSITAPTTETKDLYEKARAWDNYRYRWLDEQLDASAWVEGILEGMSVVQTTSPAFPGLARNYLRGLVNDTIAYWVPEYVEDKDSWLLDNVTIPDPPSQP